MTDWIESGDKAPAFTLKDAEGNKHSLKEYAGRPVVIYFYPKDDTPGCTKEACAFRDRYGELLERDVVLLGVSADDAQSHQKFTAKYELPFPLLVDDGFKYATKLGAYREKNMYGKKSMGIQRSTFLIAPDGKIAKVWKRVKVDGHDQQVIDAVDALADA
ncbi:MAG: thioredoxin-dependent thiol peroxidase [Planctomycetota bacterium]